MLAAAAAATARRGGVHVRALKKGVGSMERYRKEGSERILRGDAGFANKATPPQRASPLPPSPWNSRRREGRKWGRGGRRKGRMERRERVGSEGARTRDKDWYVGRMEQGGRGASLTPPCHHH